jgi:hypothetical protein
MAAPYRLHADGRSDLLPVVGASSNPRSTLRRVCCGVRSGSLRRPRPTRLTGQGRRCVLHALPCLARGGLRVIPAQLGCAPRSLPSATEFRFDALKSTPMQVGATEALPAISICRLAFLIGERRNRHVLGAMVAPPVARLGYRVDGQSPHPVCDALRATRILRCLRRSVRRPRGWCMCGGIGNALRIATTVFGVGQISSPENVLHVGMRRPRSIERSLRQPRRNGSARVPSRMRLRICRSRAPWRGHRDTAPPTRSSLVHACASANACITKVYAAEVATVSGLS